MRKRENKNYSFVPSLPDAKFKIPKTIAKKFKKLNITIMAPFRAKVGGKRIREVENKNYRFTPFLSGAEKKMPKKKQKNENIPLWPHFKPK